MRARLGGVPECLTTYPFDVPSRLIGRLQRRSRDGNVYADVKFRGSWDGILVIDRSHRCIGVYAGRRVVEVPLPFHEDEMEDFRSPSLGNRVLSQLPLGLDPYTAGSRGIVFLGPASFAAGALVSAWIALITVPVAFVGVWLMYQVRGFPFLRLPLAMLGIACALGGVTLFLSMRHLYR